MSRQLCHGGRGEKKHWHKVFEELVFFLLARGSIGLKCLQIAATSHITTLPQVISKTSLPGLRRRSWQLYCLEAGPETVASN